MQKRKVEEVKRNFSRFCTHLVRDNNIPKHKKRIILMKKLSEAEINLIKLGASKKSFHYINKVYVLTYRKLS